MAIEAWWRQDGCHSGCDSGFGWVGAREGVKGGGRPSRVLVEAFVRVFSV